MTLTGYELALENRTGGTFNVTGPHPDDAELGCAGSLILAADDENEVAGVVAHEIAHVTQQHLYRALEQQKAMTIPMILGMLAIAVAGGGDGQAIAGAVMTGQAAAAQAAINYTRQNEYEADRIGISTLSRAGYDPAGMGEFFEEMARITRAMGEGPS